MKRIIVSLILAIYFAPFYSQQKIGEWRDYFSYSSCKTVKLINNKVVASNGIGLFFYLPEENTFLRLNKTNGLNDIDICSLSSLVSSKLVVGYENGNIDIINDDEIVSIPDLKNKNMLGSKKINHFFELNNKIYCSMPFGIMVINPDKYEISDTYYIGPGGSNLEVNQISEYNGDLYAATEKGILKAPADSPLLGDYNTWHETTGIPENFSSVIKYNDILVASKGTTGNRNDIYILKNGEWIFIKSFDYFRGLTVGNSLLGVITNTSVTLFNSNLEETRKISSYEFEGNETSAPSINDAIIDENTGTLFIADNNYGIVEIQENNTDNYYYPDGPMSNNVYDIAASEKCIYTTAGGITTSWNNLMYPGEYSYFDGTSWKKFRRDYQNEEQKYWRDFLDIAIDPNDPAHAYICSWGTGVFEVDEGDLIQNYNQYNSGLQNIDWTGSENYVRVGGIVVDNDGNVWMNNGEVDYGLVVKTNDDKWLRYSYKAISDLHSMGQIIKTRNNIFWMIIPRTTLAGLFVFDINNTIEDQTDDRYRCPLSRYSDSDNRNAGKLLIWDENGEEITTNVYSLAEDKNGYIWVGTNNGILVYYRPYAIFDEEKPIASRIKVPRNDGTNLADYLLEKETVTAIAVDGGNRKWLGTLGSGLFLVSEDGTKTLASFNTDNSPLISNSIKSLAIQPKTGELFIGTDKGIISYKALATEGENSLNKIYAYPNPVRENYSGDIIITGLMENSVIKIVDVSGKLVYETKSVGGRAKWNGENLHGEKVKSGVYIVFVSTEDGLEKNATKILIVN
ncbi:MAG: T9SS type A sorting domain-containing protein [Chlorobi bacterium]|nr:T9SS type A sorting domain-containing protein [Chlorobiota bacterium]